MTETEIPLTLTLDDLAKRPGFEWLKQMLTDIEGMSAAELISRKDEIVSRAMEECRKEKLK